jgi:hypothetical protein
VVVVWYRRGGLVNQTIRSPKDSTNAEKAVLELVNAVRRRRADEKVLQEQRRRMEDEEKKRKGTKEERREIVF